jgi:hypothetical protein
MATWIILWRFGIFYDHLVHFVFIWYNFPVLVSCTKKNLATLRGTVSVMPVEEKLKKKKKTVGSLLSNLGPAELKLENVRQLRRDVGVQGPCQVPGLHDPVVVEIAGKNT